MFFVTVFSLKTRNCRCIIQDCFKRLKSSQAWLERQRNDPYVEKAKRENYRCRSAFKLLEMNERFKFLEPGQCVVDIGAAPGSWTQVLVNKTNSNGANKKQKIGKVIAVDKITFHEVEGAIILSGMDITSLKTQKKILEVLDNKKVDFILSDMAPNSTGVKSLDHDVIFNLSLTVLRLAVTVTNINGGCLIKVWDGGLTIQLINEISRFYESVRQVKPQASRSDSAECYLLCKNFKGLKT